MMMMVMLVVFFVEDARGAVHKTLAVKMMMVMMMIIIMACNGVFGDDEVNQGDVFYDDSHNDDLEMKIPTISCQKILYQTPGRAPFPLCLFQSLCLCNGH